MQIYVHRSTKERMKLLEVDESTKVADAVGVTDGEMVWIEGAEAPIDPGSSTAAAIHDRGHVHVNRCHRVTVPVSYNGVTKSDDFAPATTIRRVFEWATGKKGFDLSKEDKAELALQFCGTNDQPELTDHVGSFVTEESCEVCFELVPKQVIQG